MESAFRPRAQRFPIQALLRFRENSGEEWSEGITVNISRSGVLFWTEKKIEPKTVLEMRIVFPEANVLCWGPVVRFAPPDPPDSRPHLAAAILRYRLTRAREVFPKRRRKHSPLNGTSRIA